MAKTLYRHTQPARTVFAFLLPTLLLALVIAGVSGAHPIALFVPVMLLVAALLFHSLTVEVTGEAVGLRFGWGPISRRFALADVRAARAVRNRWFYGWGIRLTPHGWLYNVSGLDAVELELATGKRVRIGTDEPRALVRAIEKAQRRIG